MSLINTLSAAVAGALEHRARAAVRRELLSLPEHRLRDLGFSHAALLEGVKAWPWQIGAAPAPVAPSQPVVSRRALRRAERELRALSDRELFELGICRADIPAAVNGDLVRVA